MTLDVDTIHRSKNTAERIADSLRKAISQGKLQGGQSLRQDQIAALYSVSKIPVREAFFQLQAEGLIDMVPNKGATVSILTAAEIDEVYVMRIALETEALRRAIPNMTTDDLLQAEAVLNRIDHEGNVGKWAELNWEFHERLYIPSGMHRLLEMVKSLHANVVRYLVSTQVVTTNGYLTTSQREHRQILELCRQGEVDAACRCLRQHLSGADQALTNR
ncbi:MAG: GntR family transcriptional regulator [Anaerolineales bacterium]|nr:GntR family transcriptional regulator [Anaerolineales bacterium]